MTTARIILVGCGKTKAPEACAARELYTGNLFRAARDYAEAEVAAGRAAGWAILSGKHRLVRPDRVLAPYDYKLSHLGNADDPMWGRVCLNDVHQMTLEADQVELVVLAGAAYVQQLERCMMPNETITIVTPLAGLEVGERLAWFKAHREVAARPTPRYVRSKRRPAGEIPPLPACACGAPSVVWCDGRSWCEPCANARAAAAELDTAHEEAIDEDYRREQRPELYAACPKCSAAAGDRCRDYRGVKKATCRERFEVPAVVDAGERARTRGRLAWLGQAPGFLDVSGRGPAVMRATMQRADVCTGCEEACGFCPHAARGPELVALPRGAGHVEARGSEHSTDRAHSLGDCCAEKAGGRGFCRASSSALLEVPGLGTVRACATHLRRHLRHQAGEAVRVVKWGAVARVDAEWNMDDKWRVDATIGGILEAARHTRRVVARDLAAGQLSLAFA